MLVYISVLQLLGMGRLFPGPLRADLRRREWSSSVTRRLMCGCQCPASLGGGGPGLDGKLPAGRTIADQFGRHERWGRLVKQFASDHVAGMDIHHKTLAADGRGIVASDPARRIACSPSLRVRSMTSRP